MINGRIGNNDFTNISSEGKFVVDYVLNPMTKLMIYLILIYTQCLMLED